MKIGLILLKLNYLFGLFTAAKLGLRATRHHNSQFDDLPPKTMVLLRKVLKQQRCKLYGLRFC